MTSVYKVLAQSAPAANTATSIYTVPASTETIISTIVVANRSATADNFLIRLRPNNATASTQQILAADVAVAGNDSTTLTLGVTLDAADVLVVRSTNGTSSFNVFGTEISEGVL